MFSADHFIWIGIVVVLVVLLTFLSSKFKWSYRTCTIIIFVIYVWNELFKIMTHMFDASRWLGEGATIDGFEGAMYLLPKSLPFQICSSMIFFVAYLVFGKNEKKQATIRSMIVPIFLLFGSLAVIFGTCLSKDNTANLFDSFKDPQCGPIQFFCYHGGMVWYAVYLIKNKYVEINFKSFVKTLILLYTLMVGAIYVNSVLLQYETNFMFMVAPPAKGLPMLNLNHGWHAYIAHYFFLSGVALALFHTPWFIIEARKKKLAQKSA